MNCKQRLLFFTAEPWSTFRPDVAVLFGKELPKQGVCTDLAAPAVAGTNAAPWGGGTARLCAVEGGKPRGTVAIWWHRLRCLLSAKPDTCQPIQVRDLPIFAALVLKDPLPRIHEILQFMGIVPSQRHDVAIHALNLKSRPEAWEKWQPDVRQVVTDIQETYLRQYGYVRPSSVTSL